MKRLEAGCSLAAVFAVSSLKVDAVIWNLFVDNVPLSPLLERRLAPTMAAAAPTSMDAMTMLQRQMEVSGALRDKVTKPEELERIRLIMADLTVFFTQINRLATKLQLPLEVVFQCLMQIGMGDTVNFDKQCRQGNVPMHQAKVLDRNSSLNAQKAEPRIREELPEDKLMQLVDQCKTLRTLVRMKVEDGNDLSMARKLVTLAHEYLGYIYEACGKDPAKTFQVYMADDEPALKKLLSGGHGSQADGMGDEGSEAAGGKPLPKDVVRGIQAECQACLLTNKAPFPQRNDALSTIKFWVETCSNEVFLEEKTFFGLFTVLHDAMKVHLAEKRSALCRTACGILSVICLRSQPALLANSRIKEVLHSWLTILLNQVHVTVAAIAQASDGVVRDVIISSQGASFVMTAISAVLHKATQAALRRRCIGYVALAVLANPFDHEHTQAVSVVQKYIGNSDDGARRLARLLGLLLEVRKDGLQPGGLWDAKVERTAASERQMVVDCANDIEQFEIVVLGYDEPSGASLLVDEKAGCPRAASTLNGSVKSASTVERDDSLKSSPMQVSVAAEVKSVEKTAMPPPVEAKKPLSQTVPVRRMEEEQNRAPPRKTTPPPRATTPGIPLSLQSLAQEQLCTPGKVERTSPTELCASLKLRRSSGGASRNNSGTF